MTEWNHSHNCRCGEIWAHALNSPDYKKAHECPKCGETQTIVHEFRDADAERDWMLNQYGTTDPISAMLALYLRGD